MNCVYDNKDTLNMCMHIVMY